MSSVRCSEAPAGSCAEMMSTPRSIFGMNPAGVTATSQTAAAISPA